ncbi:MAG: hypothetical protein INH06_30220 [Cupriavidus sp.]|nr:hypothetical protein [Cupriavidus sp.]MCA3236543.1 hypothetical protein [Cupriavidus sp.]
MRKAHTATMYSIQRDRPAVALFALLHLILLRVIAHNAPIFQGIATLKSRRISADNQHIHRRRPFAAG